MDQDAVDNLLVERKDFLHAIEFDVKPKYGTASDDSEHFLANGIIEYGPPITKILRDATQLVQQVKVCYLYSCK